jgi:hypothetical protein
MNRYLPLLGLFLLSGSVHAQGTCAMAMPITTGTYTVAAVAGTQVPQPVCSTGGTGATHGEWYTYTATMDTALRVTTDFPVNTGVDTRVQVYVGSCGALSCVAGDDDSGSGNLAVTTFDVTAGTTYTIAFDDRYSGEGFDFELLEVPPQPPSLVNFTPQAIVASGLAFCVVDMNNDGLDDVVDVGPTTIRVNYQQTGGGFLPTSYTTTAADHPASWSICAGDLDGNGHNDLMYGASDGVTFMLASADGSAFTELSFAEYIFCQRTNLVDINNDGHLDAFSCHDIDANVYFLNDGAGNFSFNQGGLGEDCGNYGSVWTDIDNDHDLDLFVAKCGCDPVDICYRNNGDGTFTNAAAPLGFADSQQSWSSAWADFDNDGDLDVLIGTSAADYQKLMRNDGSTFTNVTPGSGFDASGVSNIDWVAHDFNNDGRVDVLGDNTMFLNNGDMTFTAGIVLPHNGPIGDLNNDGYLDIQNNNNLYMNAGGTNHYLVVNTVGTLSNKNAIGARVQITSALGTQIRDVKSGDQFHFMSSLKTYFGLGTDTEVSNLTIYWPSGLVSSIDNPAIDGTLTVVEDVNTGLQATTTDAFGVYPSPATDVLHVRANTDLANRPLVITDLSGKEAMRTKLRNGTIDVSGLARGSYLLQVQAGKTLLNGRFVKQ